MKFAMAGAQDQGEFFTPVSLVQTIVNVIEPDHGTILDPACGSGGMFVQTSHFLERTGRSIPPDTRYERYVISNKQMRVRLDPTKANSLLLALLQANDSIFDRYE